MGKFYVVSIDEEFEKARTKGAKDKYKRRTRAQAIKYFSTQKIGFLGSEVPFKRQDVKLVRNKVHGKAWLDESTGEVISAK